MLGFRVGVDWGEVEIYVRHEPVGFSVFRSTGSLLEGSASMRLVSSHRH